MTSTSKGTCACGAEIPAQWDPDWNQWMQGWQCLPCTSAAEARQREEQIAAAMAAAEIPERWQQMSLRIFLQAGPREDWASFRDRLDACTAPTVGITPWNKPAARLVRRWQPDAPGTQPEGHLMLAGPVGGGKSLLALAALADAIRRDPSLDGLFLPEPVLLEAMHLEIAGVRKRGILVRAATTRALVLDELGSGGRASEWHQTSIEFLINTRYNAGLPTLITTNKSLEQLRALYGDRIHSRIVEMIGGTRKQLPRLQEVIGVDWRTDMEHSSQIVET